MFNKLKNLIWRHKKIVKFLVVGSSGAVIDFGILALLVELAGWQPLIANLISFSVAMISNFWLNKLWTWRDGSAEYKKQFVKFTITSVVGLAINSLFLWLSLLVGLHYLIAKIIASIVVAVWNFGINNYWTFSQSKTKIEI